MSFFILGLPRSRTAWLANFLTYGKTFCHHEGMNGCRSIEEYRKKIGSNGDAGTGLMLLDLDRLFPESPRVIIESDPKKAIAFAKKAYGIDSPEWFYYLRNRLDAMGGLRIHVDEINDNLERIWSLVSREPYNRERGELLKRLRVETLDVHDIDREAMNALLQAS